MVGGSLYTSLSSCWSWIKCHLLIKMFLRFGKAGWYVVTKGKIFFRTSLFFCKADCRAINSTSGVIFFYEIVRVTSNAKAFFEVVDVLIEGFSWGVSSQRSKGFSVYETFSDLTRVTGREIRVLKSLCSLKCVQMSRSLAAKVTNSVGVSLIRVLLCFLQGQKCFFGLNRYDSIWLGCSDARSLTCPSACKCLSQEIRDIFS